MRWLAAALTCLGLLFSDPTNSCFGQESDFSGLDKYVGESLQQWGVPGVALAVIQNGEIVLSRGYGVTRVGESTPVDEQTLFAIASNTKQMTATLLAMLVDQGRIKWDDTVKTHLPELEMFDPYVTRELTIRDLLCHRNGLPDFGGDIVWWGATYGRTEVLRRIRYVRPVSSFRSRWAYQNSMFIAAGEIIARLSGESWESTIQNRLFTPIGMVHTIPNARLLETKTNVATPHMRVDDKVQSIAWRNLENGGPAAGVISNAKEMALWLRFLINDTVVDGKPLVSANSLRELWSPQMVMPITKHDRDTFGSHFRASGLGWSMRDYHGLKVLLHGGWADGMFSHTAIIPEKRVGTVVLTNLHNRDLSEPLVYRLLDQCLGLAPKDWTAEKLKLIIEHEKQQRSDFQQLEDQRHKYTQSSLPISQFVGKYENDLYGTIEVEQRHNQLRLKLSASPTFIADLAHWHHDTFNAIWLDPVAEKTFVTFSLNERGQVAAVRFRMSDFIDPSEYVYTRVD